MSDITELKPGLFYKKYNSMGWVIEVYDRSYIVALEWNIYTEEPKIFMHKVVKFSGDVEIVDNLKYELLPLIFSYIFDGSYLGTWNNLNAWDVVNDIDTWINKLV